MIKISAGIYKFKSIHSIKNSKLKPTASKVREAIFNIIYNRYEAPKWISSTHLLDAFSGSGIVAFEAFSRKLNAATLVENDIDIFNNLKRNIFKLNLKQKINLIYSDFFNLKLNKNTYYIIYLDPPYFKNLSNLAIKKILDEKALKKNGIIISETINKYKYCKDISGYIDLEKNYGKTSITFFRFG